MRRRLRSYLAVALASLLPGAAMAQVLTSDQIFNRLNTPVEVHVDLFDDRLYSADDIKRDWRIRRHLPNVNLNTINFEFNSSSIPREERRKLRRLARALDRFLLRNPDEVFLIEGHTDAVGDAHYNRELSEDRAYQVRRVLVEFFDIPPYALETAGYGEEFLLIQTGDEDWRNRRVTVRRLTEIVSRSLSRPDRLDDDTIYDLDDIPRSSVTVD
ncbi:OmpA family protein [Coralliovum pocilloporae]|uniref:OmpA family protein n=1 Tax=Coralliovum pocilloporae TaxID=3066369 RepID=UPI003307BD11